MSKKNFWQMRDKKNKVETDWRVNITYTIGLVVVILGTLSMFTILLYPVMHEKVEFHIHCPVIDNMTVQSKVSDLATSNVVLTCDITARIPTWLISQELN